VAVVTFSVLRTLTRLALRMAWSVSHAVEPELARAWGAQDMPLMRGLYAHGLRASFWLALLAAVVLHFLGGWIVLLWTHGRVRLNLLLFNWLLLSAVTNVLWYSGMNLLKAANRHLRPAVWYVIASLLAVMMAMLLLRVTGHLADAGFALWLMDALMAVYLLRRASALVQLPVMGLLGTMLDIRPDLKRLMTRSIHASK
jgi:O-antigen/teichoic acid export membrane protein